MTKFVDAVKPQSPAERWLASRLEAGGARVDAVLAHGKRDGHTEAVLRAAHRALGFVQFPEPGTHALAWSTFFRCMAPDAKGIVVWADAVPSAQGPAPPAPPLPSKSAMRYRPPLSVPKPFAPGYNEAVLADRRLGIAMADEARGREGLAEALVHRAGVSVREARGILSRAPRGAGMTSLRAEQIYASRREQSKGRQ